MKHLAVGFLCFLTSLLCLCVMELYNDVAPWEGVLLGFAATISIIGCVGAAVAIAESK